MPKSYKRAWDSPEDRILLYRHFKPSFYLRHWCSTAPPTSTPRHFWQVLPSIPNSLVPKLALCLTRLNWG